MSQVHEVIEDGENCERQLSLVASHHEDDRCHEGDLSLFQEEFTPLAIHEQVIEEVVDGEGDLSLFTRQQDEIRRWEGELTHLSLFTKQYDDIRSCMGRQDNLRREGELSLFASQNVDVRSLIWQAPMGSETRELTRVYDYRLLENYPITLQINREGRAMGNALYPNIWEPRSVPLFSPPILFNYRVDSRYFTSRRHMFDMVRELGDDVKHIQAITMPSNIIPGIIVSPAHHSIPRGSYLQQRPGWHEKSPFPFQNLKHFIVEDPRCSSEDQSAHRLSDVVFAENLHQEIEKFFQEEHQRYPDVGIPIVIIRSQRRGLDRCDDCIAYDRQRSYGLDDN